MLLDRAPSIESLTELANQMVEQVNNFTSAFRLFSPCFYDYQAMYLFLDNLV